MQARGLALWSNPIVSPPSEICRYIHLAQELKPWSVEMKGWGGNGSKNECLWVKTLQALRPQMHSWRNRRTHDSGVGEAATIWGTNGKVILNALHSERMWQTHARRTASSLGIIYLARPPGLITTNMDSGEGVISLYTKAHILTFITCWTVWDCCCHMSTEERVFRKKSFHKIRSWNT